MKQWIYLAPCCNNRFSMPFFKRSFLALSLLFLLFSLAAAQNSTARSENIAEVTDRLLGPDDLLLNGTRYLPENLHATGSPDFEAGLSDLSSLFIKGQGFYNIHLAYDIVSDKVILVQLLGNGLENRILLNPSFVDSFRIGNNLFINPGNQNYSIDGYFEQISSGNVRFLKKYTKKYLQIYDASNRGKYSPQTFSCFLLDSNGTLTAIKSRGRFLKYYSGHKKEVRTFMNEHKISLRRSGNTELRELMHYCNSFGDEKN